MSGPSTSWGRAVDAALADGDWHPMEDVVAAGVAAVPPGVAYRQGERRRRELPNAPAERKQGDTLTAVNAGARRHVRNLILSRIGTGTIERRGEQIRRRP